MTTSKERERQIHERALKIKQELGSDVSRAEDYHDTARRLIEQEEELGMPVNPYPLNQEATGKEGAQETPADFWRDARSTRRE